MGAAVRRKVAAQALVALTSWYAAFKVRRLSAEIP
jgi:hypothetical protein